MNHDLFKLLHNFLPLGAIIKTSQTSHTLAACISEDIWMELLQRHFPSHFLYYERKYNQTTKWREEYICAYRALSIRYINGASLQQCKVFNFNPSIIDPKVIKELLNSKLSYELGLNFVPIGQNVRLCCYYEGSVVLFSPTEKDSTAFVVTDSSKAEGEKPVASVTTKNINGALITSQYSMWKNYVFNCTLDQTLVCYDLNNRGEIVWQKDLGSHFVDAEIVVFEQMVFFVVASSALICVDAIDGRDIFRIHPSVVGYGTSTAYKYPSPGSQIVFDGDFVIWIASKIPRSNLIAVANWKTHTMVQLVNVDEVQGFTSASDTKTVSLSRFSVRNGILYSVATLRNDYHTLIAIHLGYSSTGQEFKAPSVLWNFTPRVGIFDVFTSPCAPCLYGNKVFLAGVNLSIKNHWFYIFALDSESGNIWKFAFKCDIQEQKVYNGITLDFFVIEGTSTILERKQHANKYWNSKPSSGNNLQVSDSDEGIRETVLIETKITDTGVITNHPTLRFAVKISGLYHVCALIAETGELLFFNTYPATDMRSINQSAVSKYSKPKYLAMAK